MNPCRCGRASEPGFSCRRGANTRCAADYQARISGPLIDRIDLHIEVPAVTAADLILPPPAEGSREIAERVAAARERQAARYAAIGLPHVRSNATVSGAVLEGVAKPDGSGLTTLARSRRRDAALRPRLSPRAARRPHAGRSRRRRQSRPRSSRRGVVLPGAGRRGAARGLAHHPIKISPRHCRHGWRRACRSRPKTPAASRRDRGIRRASGSSPW